MDDKDFHDTYSTLISHYNELLNDIYAQPEDVGHRAMAVEILTKWMPILPSVKTVLDVGCGEGYLQEVFESFKKEYTGVTLGDDFIVATENKHNVRNMDFNFLQFPNNSFDMIFSRHSLEHSPFPLLTLMEWHRVAKDFLMLIVPTPSVWGWGGKNHYSVMELEQLTWLLDRAGFHILWTNDADKREFRLLCEKKHVIGN